MVRYPASSAVGVDGGGDGGGDSGLGSGAGGGGGGAGTARWAVGEDCWRAGAGGGSEKYALVGVCRAGPAGASRGGTATRCSSLITGVTGAANRPGVSPATGNSVDDEVVNMVIPATTSTSAALATRAITAPGIPRISPVVRSAHRRVPGAYPDCVMAPSSSSSWLSPSMGMTGWSVTVAAMGSVLVTGWKRSTICRVGGGVAGSEQLTKMGSPPLDSVLRAGP